MVVLRAIQAMTARGTLLALQHNPGNGQVEPSTCVLNISTATAPVLYIRQRAYPGNTAEEFTATAQYNLWANVISRVEFRWDHVEHGNFFGASSGPHCGDANQGNDFLLALNLIYQF